jgi:hypothetical protein
MRLIVAKGFAAINRDTILRYSVHVSRHDSNEGEILIDW